MIEYTRKYVAFVDLLGFSNMVMDSEHKEGGPDSVWTALDRFRNTATASPEDDFQISQFSDCLVISSSANQEGLMALITALKTIADNLLQQDMLVRGAICVGPFVHDEGVAFGPPLITAYEMESKRVSLPMIEFSPEVMEDVRRLPRDIGQIVAFRFKERPENWYLHYLLDWSYYTAEPRLGGIVRDEPGRLVRHYIARRLHEHTGSMRDKAVWMQRYWDRTVAAAGYFPEVDPDADLPYPQGAKPYRTRIMKLAKSS